MHEQVPLRPFRHDSFRPQNAGVRPLPALLLALACGACGVREREALVGRYVVRGRPGEAWVLEDDGSCRIERGATVVRCEWEYREDASGVTLLVTLAEGAAGSTHRRRYRLTPSRWPGQPVTIPLDREATLEKAPS
jgi:hypothetical protein